MLWVGSFALVRRRMVASERPGRLIDGRQAERGMVSRTTSPVTLPAALPVTLNPAHLRSSGPLSSPSVSLGTYSLWSAGTLGHPYCLYPGREEECAPAPCFPGGRPRFLGRRCHRSTSARDTRISPQPVRLAGREPARTAEFSVVRHTPLRADAADNRYHFVWSMAAAYPRNIIPSNSLI